jgi:hypothetical protein
MDTGYIFIIYWCEEKGGRKDGGKEGGRVS